MKHIIIYSHGFAVDKTDRGLFSDIANSIPEAEHVMFNYDEKNKNGETVAEGFINRKNKLLSVYNNTREQNPDAIIDLICHSQGCVVAALAKIDGIRKTVFLAPPLNLKNGTEEKEKMLQLDAATELPDGTISWARQDGSTTIIKPEFWQDYDAVPNMKSLASNLNHTSELLIIRANHDEIIADNPYDGLDESVNVIGIDTDHNFTGKGRNEAINCIYNVLMEDINEKS